MVDLGAIFLCMWRFRFIVNVELMRLAVFKLVVFIYERAIMKVAIFKVVIPVLCVAVAVSSCSKSDSTGDAANKIVACKLDDFNQCFEWINLTDLLVDSLSSTCVNDDNGIIVDSCPTENVIGICEELNDSNTPDLMNYFYMSQSGIDPVYYASLKEQGCIDAGGIWNPVN